VLPAAYVGAFSRFEFLVDVEEMPDFPGDVRGNIVKVLYPGEPRVVGLDGEDLRVRAVLVAHPEDADRPDRDLAAREGGFLEHDHCVQRVAILGQRVRDEAVVERVTGRGEQHPVQAYPAGFVIHFVLVPRTLRNLDDDLDFHRSSSAG
jgi:hypothetical protein